MIKYTRSQRLRNMFKRFNHSKRVFTSKIHIQSDVAEPVKVQKPTVICKQVLGCLNLFVKDHVENQNARQLNVHIT